MLIKSCDKCGSTTNVKTYKVPFPKTVFATGGKGQRTAIAWDHDLSEKDLDICEKCAADVFIDAIMTAMYNVNEKGEIER